MKTLKVFIPDEPSQLCVSLKRQREMSVSHSKVFWFWSLLFRLLVSSYCSNWPVFPFWLTKIAPRTFNHQSHVMIRLCTYHHHHRHHLHHHHPTLRLHISPWFSIFVFAMNHVLTLSSVVTRSLPLFISFTTNYRTLPYCTFRYFYLLFYYYTSYSYYYCYCYYYQPPRYYFDFSHTATYSFFAVLFVVGELNTCEKRDP